MALAGVVGPFGRAVASEAYSDGRLEVLVVMLDTAAVSGIAGTLMGFMTSKAQQRMAQFEGAGDGGFWMGQDMLIVSSGETRYAVRVTGPEPVERRQQIAETIAKVVIEGPAVAPEARLDAMSGMPGGSMAAPIIAAAAIVAAAGARGRDDDPVVRAPEIAEAVTPETDFPGWNSGDPVAGEQDPVEPALEAFAVAEASPALPSEVVYTPPPVIAGRTGSEPPAVRSVATADGRDIVPADIRAPSAGFPRPGRRFGPDDGAVARPPAHAKPAETVTHATTGPTGNPADETETVVMEAASGNDADGREAHPVTVRGFPTPRASHEDSDHPPVPAHEPSPDDTSSRGPQEAAKSPGRNPWKR